MSRHSGYAICANCVMDTTDSAIVFDGRVSVIIATHSKNQFFLIGEQTRLAG
jgi:hypothetical protein